MAFESMVAKPVEIEFDRKRFQALIADQIGVGPASWMKDGARPGHLRFAAVIALSVPSCREKADVRPIVPMFVNDLGFRMDDSQCPRARVSMQLELEAFERGVLFHLRFVQYCARIEG